MNTMIIFEIHVLDKASYCSPTGNTSSIFSSLKMKILVGSFSAGEERRKKEDLPTEERRVEVDSTCHHRNSEHGHTHALCILCQRCANSRNSLEMKMFFLVLSYSHISSCSNRGWHLNPPSSVPDCSGQVTAPSCMLSQNNHSTVPV